MEWYEWVGYGMLLWIGMAGLFLWFWKRFWDMIHEKEAECMREHSQMDADATNAENRYPGIRRE